MKLQNIVFPVDFSERSYAAAPFVQSMARRYQASVSLLHAIQPPPLLYCEVGAIYPDTYDAAPIAASLATRLHEFASQQFPHMETNCTVLKGDPAASIVDYARDIDADLIALPTHGYGLFRRALLGSVTTRVLHDSLVPVWTSAHCSEASHRAHPQPRHIIAAVDLKDETERTLQTALALARDSAASVEIVYIAGEEQVSTALRQKAVAQAVANAAASTALLVEEREPVDLPVEAHGEPVASAVRRIAVLKRADLVVIGRGSVHGHLLQRMRSHAYAVICESPCPVLSV
jgi:nucleotide-binding universal stress UspA family protein